MSIQMLQNISKPYRVSIDTAVKHNYFFVDGDRNWEVNEALCQRCEYFLHIVIVF